MVEICFRYMPEQPKTPLDPSSRGLKTSWSKSFEKLRYELSRIAATDVVIEAGYKPGQVRADGWPYSNARPEHGDVRVSFKRKGVPMSFTCAHWKATEMNVYLIALTLERLRAIERYGCTKGGQQYTGWSQLPPGTGRGPIIADAFPTVEEAARFLLRTARLREGDAGNVIKSADTLTTVYRAAAKVAHPDAGGSTDLFARVNAAKEMVERTQSGGGQ